MWTINLNDYDVETLWVYKGRTLNMESSSNDNKPRLTRCQQRLEFYLANRHPEWGRMFSYVMATELDEGGNWEDERPAKQQKHDSDQL
jgi:hypothetical protein